MLQKYHPNPLSHFLALHNASQAATHHNHVVDAHTLATTLANSHSQFHHHQQHNQQQTLLHQHHHHHHQQHHHHSHNQQQQQQHQTAAALLAANQHHNSHLQLAAVAAAQHLNYHNSPGQQHLHSPPTQQASRTPPHNPGEQLTPPNNNSSPTPNHSSLRHHHSRHTQQLIEAAAAVNTTLDAGKSFTIAAILGLQKSAMESSCKEYSNNVINLSLNGGSNSSSSNHNNNNNHNEEHDNINDNDSLQRQTTGVATPETQRNSMDEPQHHQHQHTHHHSHSHGQHGNNSNNNNNREVTNLNLNKSSTNICNSFHVTTATANANLSAASTVNSFNCDNAAGAAAATVLMNRYLPTAMVNVTGAGVVAASAPSMVSFAGTPVMAHQQHSRANGFVGGAPSALQSLQQLHQQHAAHQTTLSFQREKLKSENNAKKSSLKNKRVRTIFTPEQLERLEAEFERQQYMVGPERLYLAHTLQLTEAQVKVWFQNRRIKWRKHHLEMTQQRLALLRQTQIVPGNNEQAPVKIDGTDDEDCDPIKREELRDFNDSRQDTESELSVCNDSMDAESIIDDEEET